MMEQLGRQVKAANGAKLEWHFAEEATMKEFKSFLSESKAGREMLEKVNFNYTPVKKQ